MAHCSGVIYRGIWINGHPMGRCPGFAPGLTGSSGVTSGSGHVLSWLALDSFMGGMDRGAGRGIYNPLLRNSCSVVSLDSRRHRGPWTLEPHMVLRAGLPVITGSASLGLSQPQGSGCLAPYLVSILPLPTVLSALHVTSGGLWLLEFSAGASSPWCPLGMCEDLLLASRARAPL